VRRCGGSDPSAPRPLRAAQAVRLPRTGRGWREMHPDEMRSFARRQAGPPSRPSPAARGERELRIERVTAVSRSGRVQSAKADLG